MSKFFSMGGYAVFIWLSFLISFAVLAGIAIVSMRTYQEQKARLAALEADEREVDERTAAPEQVG